MKDHANNSNHLPLLMNLAVTRTGEDTLPGRYDRMQDVWVIEDENGFKPIIEVAESLAELNTKTFVEREQDDPGAMAYLEASTKTEARPERDDFVHTSMLDVLQLLTKTKVQTERDD
jgi:hypothetical protein